MQRLIDEYNIPKEIVDIWCKEEGDKLLDVQIKAIEHFGLLEGKNLIITAPSSAGKTFVGEIAAINSYCQHKKTIILVPMKAIAEEKYHEFKRKYAEFGLNIAISTRDHTEFDDEILIGNFNVAIVIFEKMNILLTKNSNMLNNCGLIVVDELQLLNERSRGAILEILITKIKNLAPKNIQFLGLSAVLADLNGFDKWTNAINCNMTKRPLELHEGVLYTDGTLNICKFNSREEYEEKIPQIEAIPFLPGHISEKVTIKRIIKLCEYYLNNKTRILIFRKFKPLTISTAQEIASNFNLNRANNVINKLNDVESTNLTEVLIECLNKGIAFHNADLSAEERLIIESDFRDTEGQIKVICATSTLAMGVNLPASLVIIPDTDKLDSNARKFQQMPISTSEYKNMAGRAGRTRFMEEGRSILITNSKADAMRYHTNYIHGKLDKLSPALINDDLRKIMLDLLNIEPYQTKEDIKNLLLSSYTGYMRWNRNKEAQKSFEKTLTKNYVYLRSNNLLDIENENVYITELGSLCAATGVKIKSFILLLETLKMIDTKNWKIWDIIFPSLHCEELKDIIRIYIKTNNIENLEEIVEGMNINIQPLYKWSMSVLNDKEELNKRIKSFLILNDWINSVEIHKIENRYTPPGHNKFLAGTIRKIVENVTWMIQTLYQIAKVLNYDNQFIKELQILSERISKGVQVEGLDLAKLKVKGLKRVMIKKLVDNNYSSLDILLETPVDRFRGIIDPRIARKIQETIIEKNEESQNRAKLSQLYRLERYNYNTQIIRDIYEKESEDLEYAIVDLLNAPPLELDAKRIRNQRKGEPDIRLLLNADLLVGSVTASTNENKNITNRKCCEIITSGARMNPSSFVVFGRPDFHELAIYNAKHVNNQLKSGKSYKLIPIRELGELFVQIVEEKITKNEFIDIIMNEKGYVQANSINN